VGFGGAELVLHPKGEYIYIRDLNLVLTAKLLKRGMCWVLYRMVTFNPS
jgi:hypothetical protein